MHFFHTVIEIFVEKHLIFAHGQNFDVWTILLGNNSGQLIVCNFAPIGIE